MKADLHIHSLFSNDGEKNISEIVSLCKTYQVELYSITDHNSIRGNREAASLAASSPGLHFVPGIEIDCRYRGTDLHLLGYHIDWEHTDFEILEKQVRKKYMDAVPEMVDNLARAGISIDLEELMAKSDGQVPSAELFAEVLLSNRAYHEYEKLKPYLAGGHRSDMPLINFYLDFFAQGKPAYVPIEHLPFREAIALVRDHGGIPVIAHPGLNFKGREQEVEDLLDHGADGLEVFNNYHNEEQTDLFARMAGRRKALITCGSDFHGKIKPGIRIGQYGKTAAFGERLSDSLRQLIAVNQ
jgi:predicted metal-dependent phosphoesterase TrpH